MTDTLENGDEPENSQTLGQVLVAARLTCQISQSDMATKLCLGIKVVEEIEEDRLDDTVNPLFNKGYVKNYAKLVGVDQGLVVELFEQQYRSIDPPGKMQSFSQRNKAQTHNSYLNSVTIVIVLGLVAMLIAWWWQQRNEAATVSDNAESSIAQPALAQSSGNLESQPLDEIVPSLAPVLHAKGSTDKLAGAENSISDAEQISVSHRLELTFSQDCWVKVTDASNEVLALGIKKAGSVMQLDGVPPFEVTLGAPGAVSVTHQDKPLDFTAFITGNKARFRVPLEE